MPSFCRHGRFIDNCPICSKKERTRPGVTSSGTSVGGRRPTPASPAKPAARRTRGAGAVTVKRMARATDDGYANNLVPGLRASADAERLADELAFAAGRLNELATNPPGLYADVAAHKASGDVEEALWLAFLIAWYSPLENADDPFAAIRGAAVPWSTGELPALEGVPVGPRSAHVPEKAAAAFEFYRAWAARGGGQHPALAGDEAWTPQRRFDRAYERVALPGFTRPARYEFLVSIGRLGLVDVEPSTLVFSEALAPTTTAAKRIFGIGDAMNLGRRLSDFVAHCEVPVAAFDLALENWILPVGSDRITSGSQAEPDADVRARVGASLGV